MVRFIIPFTDVGFKRIFGQEFSKPLLLDFLNNLLKGEREITDITFLDKEQPSVYDSDRSLIYDIYCETADNEHIIVEMQNREQPYFKKRSLYYTCEAISRQGVRGAEWRYGITAVYFIAFLNFSLDGIGDKFRTDVALADMKTCEQFSDDMRMIYLQLPYFVKEADDCENDFERWIYVLKNMEVLNRLPWVAQNSVFEHLAKIADISAMSKADRLKYDESIKKFRDTINVMEGTFEKGVAQGMAQGKEEERIGIAKTMLAKGMSVELISELTGMSADEVKALRGKPVD